MKPCRVSAYMSVYNGEKYLHTQIDSIISQLTDEDELVISCNPSTDRSWEILKEYESKYSNIRVLFCEKMGVEANAGNALCHCRGKYLLSTDQDDCWLPGKVEAVVKVFETTNAPVVLHNMEYADGDLNPTGKFMFEERHSKPGLIRNFIKNSYHGGCMAFNAGYVDVFLPVPDGVGFGDMWNGLVGELCGKPVFLDDVYMLFRCHNNNLSSRKTRSLIVVIPERFRLTRELIRRARIIRKKRNDGTLGKFSMNLIPNMVGDE